jgi:hypothetical protein
VAGCDTRNLVAKIVRMAATNEKYEEPETFLSSAFDACGY